MGPTWRRGGVVGESSRQGSETDEKTRRGGGGRTEGANVARTAMVAAVYAAASLAAILFLGGLAWGPIQFRVSEALCVLALVTLDAIWGLTLGCALANAANIILGGTGALGLLDVVFGSLATLLGAIWCWRMRGAGSPTACTITRASAASRSYWCTTPGFPIAASAALKTVARFRWCSP